MIQANRYGISVQFGNFEGEECYVARVRELPEIAEYADTQQEAYELALDAINTTAVLLAELGRPMPPPYLAPHEYSGRVTLRLPQSLHRSLAQMAEDEGISLNYLLASVLAAFRGFDSALKVQNSEWHTIASGNKEALGPSKPLNNIVSISEPRKYQHAQAANW